MVRNHVDECLIDLCGQIADLAREAEAMGELTLDLRLDDPACEFIFAELQMIRAEMVSTAERVAAMPAHSQAGIRARAAAVRAMMPPDDIDGLLPLNWHAGLLDALLHELQA